MYADILIVTHIIELSVTQDDFMNEVMLAKWQGIGKALDMWRYKNICEKIQQLFLTHSAITGSFLISLGTAKMRREWL